MHVAAYDLQTRSVVDNATKWRNQHALDEGFL